MTSTAASTLITLESYGFPYIMGFLLIRMRVVAHVREQFIVDYASFEYIVEWEISEHANWENI